MPDNPDGFNRWATGKVLICLHIHVFGGLRIVDCFHPYSLGIDVACAAQPLPRPPF